MSAAPVPVAVQVTSSGQVFGPVRINGSRTLWFFLDTAAPTFDIYKPTIDEPRKAIYLLRR
jgi:hypothetical protein